jgi:hypothetical protein
METDRDPLMTDKLYDVFISHASEDKKEVVFPLVDQLKNLGVRVWYDEFQLKVGDSLSRSIDHGLAQSTFGVVVISPAFLRKNWPEYELRGLVSREIGGEKVILPVWHNIGREEILKYSPTLADKKALNTDGETTTDLARQLIEIVRPDIHERFLRVAVARAEALNNLNEIPISKIRVSPQRHASLPESLVARTILFQRLLEDVLPMSLSQAVDNFQRDARPESELVVWERIAACYQLATFSKKLPKSKKKHMFSVLLAASMGPVSVEDPKLRRSLSRREVNSLLDLFHGDLFAAATERSKKSRRSRTLTKSPRREGAVRKR